METLTLVFSAVTAFLGAGFLTAGTLGLLRFGDQRSRLHALAKADTLGLGFVVVALLPWVGSIGGAAKLVLVWLLALAAASVSAHLLVAKERDVAD